MDILAITDLTWTSEAIVRLVAAAALGAAIGVEREHHGRSAGFRTQLLVALGSSLAMIVSLHFAHVYGDSSAATLRVDPARVAYGVMGGIGFLGAGAIVRYGIGIRGLTTAASLWCTAAVGLACGFGMYAVAVAATAIVLIALFGLSKLDRMIPSKWYKAVTVVLPATAQLSIPELSEKLSSQGARVLDVDYLHDLENQLQRVTFHVTVSSGVGRLDLIRFIQSLPQVKSVSMQ